MVTTSFARSLTLTLALLAVLTAVGRADTLDNAVAALAALGNPLPPGYTARWGTDTAGGASGQTVPNDPSNPSAGGVIIINPEGIRVLSPGQDPSVNVNGGVVTMVLYHESLHANSHHAQVPGCDEIHVQFDTSAEACNLICWYGDLMPWANLLPLCIFYQDTRDRYNHGVSTPGGAPAAWISKGCGGPFPGLIPACGCCP